jgi:Arc-like DNA binding domain
VGRSTLKAMRRPTKPMGRSPVIAGRVPESLHQQIKEAAKQSGRSMSEELAWRAASTFAEDGLVEKVRPIIVEAVGSTKSPEADLAFELRALRDEIKLLRQSIEKEGS